MFDPRILKLADVLVGFSCNVQKGENVLIENIGGCDDLARALVKRVYEAGANPFLWLGDKALSRELLLHCNVEQLKTRAEVDAALMSKMQAYIGIRGGSNACEEADVPASRINDYATYYWTPVHGNIRVAKTKWVILRYPSPSMAQMANMSTEGFEDYFFNVCTLDYGKMDRAMDALVRRMEATDRVHIVGVGTDLSFSIKGLPAIKCAGKVNIPDGEVFTAPVRESVNGVVSFTAPSLYQGVRHERVKLVFKDGKIIDCDGSAPEAMRRVFDTDAGARYVGEFAIGVNPYIHHAMLDTLFDEKIAGSFHFTPGMCYDECPNGNKSAIHWDLVCIQTPAFGGGEIWFDDTLVRKDGAFVPADLHCLNPENLK